MRGISGYHQVIRPKSGGAHRSWYRPVINSISLLRSVWTIIQDMNTSTIPIRVRRSPLGLAWLLMCAALGLHVADEAITGFLVVYNPTVLALRASLGFWPMPTFVFREWITGLVGGIVLLLILSPFAFRNARWARPIFYSVPIVAGVLNAHEAMVPERVIPIIDAYLPSCDPLVSNTGRGQFSSENTRILS
jgi:hypothetical protein